MSRRGLSLFCEPNSLERGFLRGMRQSMRRSATVPRLVLVGCLLLDACSSRSHDDTPNPPSNLAAAGAAGEEISCADDARVDVFASGLSKTAKDGTTVTLDSGEPEPPARGDNVWNVTLADADGQPLTDVQLVVSARMPDHGHMSPTTPQATATDAEGRSTISSLNLFMAGVWVVDVAIIGADAEKPGASVSFTFCVEG